MFYRFSLLPNWISIARGALCRLPFAKVVWLMSPQLRRAIQPGSFGGEGNSSNFAPNSCHLYSSLCLTKRIHFVSRAILHKEPSAFNGISFSVLFIYILEKFGTEVQSRRTHTKWISLSLRPTDNCLLLACSSYMSLRRMHANPSTFWTR